MRRAAPSRSIEAARLAASSSATPSRPPRARARARGVARAGRRAVLPEGAKGEGAAALPPGRRMMLAGGSHLVRVRVRDRVRARVGARGRLRRGGCLRLGEQHLELGLGLGLG